MADLNVQEPARLVKRRPYRSLEEVASDFSVTPRKLAMWVKKKSVPVIRRNNAIVFDAIAEAALVESMRVSDLPRPKAAPAAPKALLTAKQIVAAARVYGGERSGVYFLIWKAQILYIGQAVNVPSRIADHRRVGMPFDRYHWIPCTEARLNVVERAYLDAYVPPLNMDSKTKRLRNGNGKNPNGKTEMPEIIKENSNLQS